MALHFSRDTKVYLKHSGRFWKIPVLDGFSFSQATNASEITLSEMSTAGNKSRRARQMFNDSYAPAEWSFQSYMRPNTGLPAEDALWASFFTDSTFNNTSKTWGSTAISGSATAGGMTVSSNSSDLSVLGTFDLYFVMGATNSSSSSDFTTSSADGITIYEISDCVVNEASIDFDVDGIATIGWSGFGKIITEAASMNTNNSALLEARNLNSTSNYIRNRLTQLSISSSQAEGVVAGDYDVTLTGGNITFTNNITYLTPETLGRINQPLEHVTGTRTITGNFTAYLDSSANKTIDLFENLIESTSVITNEFNLKFDIGGGSCSISLPKCHLEIPQHSIEDVIALDTTFHALPSDVNSADEVTITYSG